MMVVSPMMFSSGGGFDLRQWWWQLTWTRVGCAVVMSGAWAVGVFWGSRRDGCGLVIV